MTEQKIKNKKKKVHTTAFFPPELVDASDRLILRGMKRINILREMQLQFPNVEFPSEGSWLQYCTRRIAVINRDETLKKSLEALTREVNLLKVDTSNPEAVLNSIIEQASHKIEELKRQNAQVHDVGRENVIVGHLKILNDALKTQLAMQSQGYFINDKLQEAARIMSNELYKAFVEAYKKVHGDAKFSELDKALQAIMGNAYWETLEMRVSQTLIPEKLS
jgi:hypothetical protein